MLGGCRRSSHTLLRTLAAAASAACGSEPASPTINPVPAIGALSPALVTAGGADFTLVVHGSGFVATSLVRWNTLDLTTTFIGDVELRAIVPSPLIGTATVAQVVVFNPAPGGGLSTSSDFEVRNPVPIVAGVSPSSLLLGSPPTNVSITGSGFVASSVARWNGTDLTTTFVSSSNLTARIGDSTLATVGTGQLSVFNHGPGGGTSANVAFAVENPAPVITSLSPSSQQIGGGALTLQITGSGFVAASIIRWNGVDRPTGYVSGTQLSATLPASDFASGGYVPVTVFNAGPGGGTSAPRTFAVGNPIPTITALAPASTTAGGPGFTLTVDGTGFVSGAEVWWGFSKRPTVFVDPTRLTAAIADTNIVGGGFIPVLVTNPAPGGGASAPDTVRVDNPTPVVTTVTPDTVMAGANIFVTVDGSGFVPGSSVLIDNAARTTTYVSAVRLTGFLQPGDVAIGGVRALRVTNPQPGGGMSSVVDLVVMNPIAAPTRLTPDNVLVGAGSMTLTVTGSGFVGSSVVRWNGLALTTSYTNASTLTATVPAARLASTGLDTITIYNPPPGGGPSPALLFAVRAPLPSATSLSPSTATPGDPGITLTVNGSGFVTGALIRWNGLARTTTFGSTTQLTATIPASDLATTTAAFVTVENPAPGGGTSGALAFTVGTPGPSTPTITSQATLTVPTKSLVFDSISGRIYASVPSTGGSYANMVIAIDPATGAVDDSVAAGSEPGELAISDDGQFLYVGLDGSPTIRRFLLPSLTFDLEILLDRDPFLGAMYAEDIEVQPGSPHTIAVSLRNQGYSPRHMGVTVIDDAIARPTRSQGHTGSNRIEFSSTPGIVFGLNNETTEFGFRRLAITAQGITEVANTGGIVQFFSLDFTYAGGRAFFTNGTIANPETRTVLGTCTMAGPVAPSPGSGRVYVLNTATSELLACSLSTYTLVGALNVPSGSGAQTLVRWAPDGLAYRTPTEVVILRTTLVR